MLLPALRLALRLLACMLLNGESEVGGATVVNMVVGASVVVVLSSVGVATLSVTTRSVEAAVVDLTVVGGTVVGGAVVGGAISHCTGLKKPSESHSSKGSLARAITHGPG